MRNISQTGPTLRGTAAVILVLALLLAAGGAWLIWLGGSWYYLAAAAGMILTAILLAVRRPLALLVYAIVIVGSLAWAYSEVGLDWWALAPRGDLLVLIGVWLLMPWVTRGLVPQFGDRPPAFWRGSGLALTLSLLVSAGVAVLAATRDEHRIAGAVAAAPGAETAGAPAGDAGEWRAYGRTNAGQRYSPLEQVNSGNVGSLAVAWEYHTGDRRGAGDTEETTYEVTPLKIGSTVYLCTPHDLVIALDAATGKERWRYDPGIEPSKSRQHQTCRGVSYDELPATPATSPAAGAGAADAAAASRAEVAAECPTRILMPTADARLVELNAETGAPCTHFAERGSIDLSANMPNWKDGFYYSTSPPVVTHGLIVIGGAVNDNVSTSEPSGVIRAYDVDTGALVWNWDSGNPDATAPIAAGATYTANSPNAWSILSADDALGLVYVPLGNQPPDQFGGNRSENVERFSSSIVALDAETGRLRWAFQGVHHDLWDYDMPAQPTLVDLTVGGESVPALVQATKQGELFVLDRRTGEPVLPVEERPAPQGAAEGDHTAPTQPVSALSFDPPPLQGRDAWGLTIFDQLYCRIAFEEMRYEGRFTPPSTEGTVVYPGNFGVFNWGGIAVDPVRQAVIGTPSYLAFTSTLIPRADPAKNYVSQGDPGINENYGAPFAAKLGAFLSPIGIPCHRPPWGYVAAADLTTGKIVWMHRNGTVRDLSPLPLPFEMGVPDLGGPLVTAGGVFFMSGSLDYYVRAFDVTDGRKLWEARLPAGGQATPMTYEEGGRQYVLVVAGGHGSTGTAPGDSVIAYALPAR